MSDEQYTPTTGQVRIAYSIIDGDASTSIIEQRERAFDRWLAAHDREVKAEALREAAAWLDDPRTLPDIDNNAAVAVIRELRYYAGAASTRFAMRDAARIAEGKQP